MSAAGVGSIYSGVLSLQEVLGCSACVRCRAEQYIDSQMLTFELGSLQDNVIMLNTCSLTSGKESPAQETGEIGETVRFEISVRAAKTQNSHYTLAVYRGLFLFLLKW